MACLREDKYLEADVARARLDELRRYEEHRKHEAMVTHQLAERISVEEANARELQKFNGAFFFSGVRVSLCGVCASSPFPSLTLPVPGLLVWRASLSQRRGIKPWAIMKSKQQNSSMPCGCATLGVCACFCAR